MFRSNSQGKRKMLMKKAFCFRKYAKLTKFRYYAIKLFLNETQMFKKIDEY